MKDVIRRNPELELPPKEGLATPYFDELAIAEARPVQPLSQRRGSTFRILRPPHKLGMLIIATVVLIAIVGLAIGINSPVDPVQPTSAEVEKEADSQASENLTGPQSTLERQATRERQAPVSGRNRRSTRLHQYFFESPGYGSVEGKPVARKVGVISN